MRTPTFHRRQILRAAATVGTMSFTPGWLRGAIAPQADSAFKPLLDEKLSNFEIWIAVPDPSVSIPGYTHAADPKEDKPLGLNNDPLHIFTLHMVDGEPVLHITGQIFGTLTTLATFGDFHLRVQQRWLTAKWAPKLGKPRDSGLLYRCYGPEGSVGNNWKRCIECQVQENDIGDFFSLGVMADVACKQTGPGDTGLWRYSPGEPLRQFKGRCARGMDYHELPNGEWNTIEVMAVGDRSVHILNGRVVNVLQHAVQAVGGNRPATTGQIQIQSEGSEVEYRRVEVKTMSAFPDEIEAVFHAPKA